MFTILGAGGVIATHLVNELAAENEPVRLVIRNPRAGVAAVQTVAADLSDLSQTVAAVSGSTTVFMVVGLKYDLAVWSEVWPKMMRNTMEACKRSGARLVFLDNVYIYGKVDRVMTEETPFNPCSQKGEIRAGIATSLLQQIKAGNLTALIARCPDFYGHGVRAGIPNVLVLATSHKESPPTGSSTTQCLIPSHSRQTLRKVWSFLPKVESHGTRRGTFQPLRTRRREENSSTWRPESSGFDPGDGY
jgi:nucleoside-diphosphate-sugar epimerase